MDCVLYFLLQGSIVVHIVCVDVNDNCPVLESGSMFTASIPENMAAGTLITLVLCVCMCVCICIYMHVYLCV